MFSKARSRALWIEEVTDDSVYSQDDQYFLMNTERLGCLNCNSENHETINCTLPSHFVFKCGNNYPRKMVLLKLCCNTVSNPRYMLPYDYPVKGTILHVNRKDNCLYVRPQNLDEICSVLENFLFDAREAVLSLAAPNKINIGSVYLIRRHGTGILARGVCAHMYYNWQMATQWQMYLIDNGQTEFVDQRSIYLLPPQLHSMPPLAIPLVLINCRLGYGGMVSCNMDHFPMLNVGSTCIFALSSSYQGRSLSLSEGGYYPNFPLYPPPLLARIFGGASLRDEIFCRWGLREITPTSHPICPLYYPSTFSFNNFTLQCPLPVTLTVRMTEKINQTYYWLRDASFCSFISKQILLPSNGLWPYIEGRRSLACIAFIQRPLRKHPRYYRAVASNFNNHTSCCTVFLIDYGQTLPCYIYNLFDLSDQPPVVLYSFAAAFCCAVNRKDPTEGRIHAAKLAVDELYVVEVIGKDETSYIATVDMHIQADFQYPRNLNTSNCTLTDNLQPLMLNCNDKINRTNEVSNNNDSSNANNDNSNNVTVDNSIGYHNYDNNSMDIRAMFPTVGMLMSSNQEIRDSLKALDVKISTKLAQMSSRIDGLSNTVRSLQLANCNRNLLPFLQTYQYSDVQGAPNNGIQSQASFPGSDGKNMIFYGTNHQSSLLLGQTPFPRFQTIAYPQHYIQQYQQHQHYYHQQHQQSNFTVPSGRCYFHGTENHRCAFTNYQPQSDYQSHIYTNHINQQVQRRTIDFTQKVYQKPLPLRAVIPGCTVCSQQRINHDNQTLRSCYFCGTCMETKQRCFISPNNTAIKHSTMSRLNATHFQPLMYASPDNHLHGTSTASANSSFKNSNTPSNADSQLSSRSNSPNNDFQLLIKSDVQHQLLPPPSSYKSNQCDRTPASLMEEREIVMINHKRNPIFPTVRVRKDGLISYRNANSQPENNSSCVAPSKISYKTQDENIPVSCWICGKVGHLTRYCQSTPPPVLLVAQEMMKEQRKKTTDKLRDERGMILYTSDESSDDELNYITANCDSDEDAKQTENSLNLDHDIKLLSDDDENEELTQELVLKYKAYFSHINIEFGQRYAVSRSDEDIASSLWPLFFVQIQSAECQQMFEMHLDSLVANIPLAVTEIAIGKLCVAYCERFDAKFRAVITEICENLVEVFYIDYGNYEWVEQNTLSSIADQDSATIAHPGMAIPCILNVYEEKIASCLSEDDVMKMKLAVSCSLWSFYLNFLKQRSDGICVVELDEEASVD